MIKQSIRRFIPLLVAIQLGVGATVAQEPELLEAERAFAFNAEMTDDGLVEATWTIADDYYMYRDKFRFELAGEGVMLGDAEFPPTKTKVDPLFGDTEVYLHQVEILLPVSGAAGSEFTLTAHGQGCNEPIGVCYPPLKYQVALALPDGMATPLTAEPAIETPLVETEPEPELETISDLRNLLGNLGDEPDFLDVDDAFQLEVIEQGPDRLSAGFRVAEGYYLYRDKIELASEGAATIGDLELPRGEPKEDEYFGKMQIFTKDFSFPIPLRRNDSGAAELTLDATYQGCADQGICYPPVKRQFTLQLPPVVANADAAESATYGAAPASGQPQEQSGDGGDRSLWALLVGAFGAGLLLTFTPCVLPMVPILSSIIAGQGHTLTKAKAGWLSFVYVLGTAVTYTAAGALAGATGNQLQAYFQNIWAIGILSLIFVLMALSMFGLYEIQMPSFIQSRLQQRSQGLKGGSTGMVFMLGLVSALIVGACVSPVLISFLGVAISRGDPLLGGALMLAMALGMGVPLILLGLGAGHLIPKAGKWMDRVKYLFGVLLLAVAIYLLGVLPQVPVLLLWAALFVIVGIYLGATQSLPEDANGWSYLAKGVGTVLLVWGVLALIGGFYGERDILKPLPRQLLSGSSVSGPTTGGEAARELLFTQVTNLQELEQEMTQARNAGKYVMLDYYADWCTDCLRMEASTLQDPAVREILDREFLSLQVDVTDPRDDQRNALKHRYGVFGPPAVLFFDPAGQELKGKHFYGYKDPQEFLTLLQSL